MFDDRDLRFDLCALGLLALTLFLGLSLLSYSPADPLGDAVAPLDAVYRPHQVEYPTNATIQNACGHAGAICADALLRLFGLGAYAVVLCLGIVDVFLLLRKPLDGLGIRTIGLLTALVSGLTILQMFLPNVGVGPAIGPGGIIGAMGRHILQSHFATAGSVILLSTLMLGGVMLCTDYVLLQIAILAATALINLTPRMQFRLGALPRWGQRRGEYDEEYEEEYDEEYEDEYEATSEREEQELVPRNRHLNDLAPLNQLASESQEAAETDELAEEAEEDVEYEYEYEDEDESEAESGQPVAATNAKESGVRGEASTKVRENKSSGSEREEVIAQLEEASRDYDPQDYELPPRTLLRAPESYDPTQLLQECQRKSRLLEKTFEDFKLDVKVKDIETGPVIAQYEVALKRGLRLSKITSLEDDLAIALRVPSVRVVAPIPGKNTVGIEVPNDERQIVRMREVMEEASPHIKKMALPIFLGKDASGTPLAVDLAKMPHLLIAGRTGTGKSVCLNSIISSMLMTKTPDDVRMLMIDPKMVELSGYARLPHLMHPVVTDMRKAEAILAWACDKMDERYRLLASAGVRHLTSYNQLGEEELMNRLQPENEEEKKLIPRHLPYIVIIADEMADLMMTAGKEVQAHIIRLASKSRAVGIHLILATQRPTADVITGLIKSNLPARIAFQVASGLDSRVVLDENGADRLLGYGDMLFLSPGTSSLLRGQGTFMSDEEIDRIVDYCSSKGEQQFVKELVQLKVEDKDADGEAVPLKKRDELYDQAIEIVIREGRGSVSLLQRNLQIGYGRAARLIDYMAEDGIVGAYNGSQAREVLMTLADLEASRNAGSGATSNTEVVEAPPQASPQAPAAASQVLNPTIAKIVAVPNSEVDEEEGYEDEELGHDDETNEAAYEDDAYGDEEDVAAQTEVEEEAADEEVDEYEEEEYEDDDELEDDDEEEELDEDELADADAEEDEYEEDEYEDELEDEELEDEDSLEGAEYEDVEVDEEEDGDVEAFDGDAFEPEDYDAPEFQEAVASEVHLQDEGANQTIDDYEGEYAAAKKGLVPKIKGKKPNRRPKRHRIHTSHAE